MRKTALLIATALLVTALTACSGNNGTGSTSAADTEQQEATATADTSAEAADNKTEDQNASQATTGEGGIDVDKGLMNVEITIPAEAAETYGFKFESQEEADAYAKEQGFKSVTLGDDGSITIVMSKAQHKKTMEELNKTLDEALQEMIGSEDYPNITAVEHDDNYTNFKVTTTSEELSFNESFSGVAFFMFGAMYNSFNGTSVDDSADDTDYAAQLEKEEYIYESDSDMAFHFIVLKNNSDQTLTIATNSIAYNESGDKIGAGSGHLEALGPQMEQLVIESLDNVSDVDHFDTTISASKAKYCEDPTLNTEVEATILEDKVILTCTYNGEQPAQYMEGRVIFLKDGECVGYDTHYFHDEEGEVKPGASLTQQFDYYDGTFDEAKYYINGMLNK